MTGIIQYIDSCLNTGTLSLADANDYKGVRKSIAAYIAPAKDTDILWLTQPSWIDRYYAHLVTDYRSNKRRNTSPTPDDSQRTALRYLKQLRKLINHAITDGTFPDIDIFTDTQAQDALTRRKRLTLQPISRHLKQLVFTHDADLYRLSKPYLLSLYLCGMPVDDAYALDPQNFDPEHHTIYLPHLRITAEYPKSLYDSVLTLKNTPPHLQTAENQQVAADLRVSPSTAFTDWLNLGIETRLIDNPRHLIALTLSGKYQPSADDRTSLRAMLNLLSNNYLRDRKHWYVLRTVSEPAIIVAQRLLDGDRRYPDKLVQRHSDIYVPHIQPAQPRTKGNAKRPKVVDPSAVLRNVIFVNVDFPTAETLDRLVPDSYIMAKRTPLGRQLQTVPYREIYTLQLVLKSIDSVQAQQQLQTEELRDTQAAQPHAVDELVRVSVPGFEQYTARITAVHRDATYDLSVDDLPFKLELKSIPQGLILAIA